MASCLGFYRLRRGRPYLSRRGENRKEKGVWSGLCLPLGSVNSLDAQTPGSPTEYADFEGR